MDRIPMFSPTYQNEAIWPALVARTEEVLRSGSYILDKHVGQFEQDLAAYVGCRHAVAVASGTDALFLTLASLGIGPGDEVITTPFTFIATAQAIVRTGATPVFADIDPLTLNLSPSTAASAVTARTAAILVVHLFGQPCDMDAFQELANARGIPIIEDAAQALGARWHGQLVGGIGDAGALSFFPSKTLGAAGDGGAIVTNRSDLDASLRMLRSHGATERYLHIALGTNSRLDEMQAAILAVKLPMLDEWNRERVQIARGYTERLAGTNCVPVAQDSRGESVFGQFTVRVTDKRDSLKAHLASCGISSAVHYPKPLHLQPALSGLGYQVGDLPEAERAAAEVLSLPCYPGLSASAQRRVSNAVGDWHVHADLDGRG